MLCGGRRKMTERETQSAHCPNCGRRFRFLADEWPESCDCGYCWELGGVCEVRGCCGTDECPMEEEEEDAEAAE